MSADIYRYLDKDGVIHFSNVPAHGMANLNSSEERAKRKRQLVEKAQDEFLRMRSMGLIETETEGPQLTVFVDPLLWPNLTHKEKEGLSLLPLITYEKFTAVVVRDMTSKAKLATASKRTGKAVILK